MTTQQFQFRFGPFDGEILDVPAPAPARLMIGDSGAMIDVSHDHRYPCYVRYLIETEGREIGVYEYEGEPPARA